MNNNTKKLKIKTKPKDPDNTNNNKNEQLQESYNLVDDADRPFELDIYERMFSMNKIETNPVENNATEAEKIILASFDYRLVFNYQRGFE
jgi:hypothetical protein